MAFLSLLRYLKLKTITVFSVLLLFSFSCYASVPVVDGTVPSWITGGQNTLVNRMREISASGLGTYYPHANPYGVDRGPIVNQYDWARWAAENPNETPATTCAYACSIALRGTPYGADADNGLSWDDTYEGDIVNVDVFRSIAEKNNEWHGKDYKPKPGDLAVTYNGNHIVMVTESGGEIAGGSGTAAKMGARALAEWPSINGDPIGYIETSKYSNSVGGAFNNAVDWGLDMLATIGDGLNDLIEQFTILADNAMGTMSAVGTGMVLSLIIIDFSSYVLLNLDNGWQLSTIIGKIMKYAFWLWVFLNWAWIINNIFLDFAQSTASALSGSSNTSSNLTQPQFLLVKGVEAVSPCLNFISNAKGLTNISNWPLLLFLVLISFIVLGALMFSAIYVTFIFVEFYITAAFNAVFMLFPVLRFTKFIGEGGLSSLIKSTIRLFTTGVLVYLLGNMIGETSLLLDFPADINALGDGTLRRYVILCSSICVFVYLIVKLPDKVSGFYSGGVNLPG